MAAATPPRILLSASESAAADEVCRLLEQAGHVVERHLLSSAAPADSSGYDLIVIDSGSATREALSCCRQLRARPVSAIVPLLYISSDSTPAARLAGLEAGADACLLRPFAATELLLHVRTWLRIKTQHARLAEKTAEVQALNLQLHKGYQQHELDLTLARRIQVRCLPQSLPLLPHVRFAVHHRPCGRTGGDCYDVVRLDEDYVGFYLADTLGHGVAAGLLTVFLTHGIQGKETTGSTYRLRAPEEVLRRLNQDWIELASAETPFLTVVYAQLSIREGSLRFARAGHPYPLHVPVAGDPELWQVPGSLLGVFDTAFADHRRQLRAGDKLVLYSDGLDGSTEEGPPLFADRLLTAAAAHRALPLPAFLEQLAQSLRSQSRPDEDATLLGMEWLGTEG